MGDVVERDDAPVVERRFLSQCGDAPAGDRQADHPGVLQRHADPGRDDEGEREPVRDDDLVLRRTGQDGVHCPVQAFRDVAPRFGAGNAESVIQTTRISVGWWEDVPRIEPHLGPALSFSIRDFAEVA